VARYYNLTYDQQNRILNAEFNADKHLHAERLDGCYLLKTSRKDLSGDELWRIYILLTRAENAFREMKSPLALRPIWHHHERRVELAYHLLIAVEKTLLDKGRDPRSRRSGDLPSPRCLRRHHQTAAHMGQAL
jgi:hypothetical protein